MSLVMEMHLVIVYGVAREVSSVVMSIGTGRAAWPLQTPIDVGPEWLHSSQVMAC